MIRTFPVAVAALCLLSACSILTSYPAMTEQARESFANGRFQEAILQLPKEETGPDELLYKLEKGLITHTSGNFSESNLEFLSAVDTVTGFKDRPSISMRSGLEGVASMVLNDKVLPYDGEGFERILLHSYLALNFFFLGKTDDAFVEARLAYETQREEEERYSTTYHGLGAFARYVSGIVRETVREPGEAYIDYRKVLELAPSNTVVRRDLFRLASMLGRNDDANQWKEGLTNSDIASTLIQLNSAECICLYQCGLGPIKVPIEVAIAHEDGVTKFAIPDFQSRNNPVDSVRLLVDDKELGVSQLLEDVDSIAKQNLKDRMVLVVANATARTVGKAALTEKLEKQHGDLGSFMGTLFAIVTEQADLRSWLTLPKSFQVARAPIPEGVHQFSVELLDQSGSVVSRIPLGKYRIRPKERVILNLRSVGPAGYAHFVGGERVQPENGS